MELLSEYKMQFGGFSGKTFKWVLENALGYTGWLVDSMRNETATSSALSQNKHAFKEYAQLFPECREVIAKKREERLKKSNQQNPTATPFSTPIQSSGGRATSVAGVHRNIGGASVHTATAAAIAPLLRQNASPHKISAAITRRLSTTKRSSVPNIPSSSRITAVRQRTPQDVSGSPYQSPESNDEELCSVVDKVELELGISRAELATTTSKPSLSSTTSNEPNPNSGQPSTSKQLQSHSAQSHEEVLLPPGWKQTLPKADHAWISKALFKTNARTGKPELDMARIDKIWWYPPQPTLISSQTPSPDKYFARPLLFWMPRKLWRVKLHCPHPGCNQKELTSAGLYPHTRQVLDVDGYYNLAAEYLECSNCHRKVYVVFKPA